MKIYYIIFYLFLFSANVLVFIPTINGLASCPAPNIDITPCDCFEDSTGTKPSAIRCFGEQTLDLQRIFEIIDANIETENKTFDLFYLYNTNVEEINENVFKDLKFRTIFIENTIKLTKIDSKAFKGLEESLNYLHIRDTKLHLNSDNSSDLKVFDELQNLKVLDFSATRCPPISLLTDKCMCDYVKQDSLILKSTVISCKHILNSEELIHVFNGLNENLRENERNFFQFKLKDSEISELTESLFKGISFSQIIIEDCLQLKTIDRNVFKTIEPFVNKLMISNINLNNDSNTSEEVWYAISGLNNLVEIDLVNVFNQIPDKAFKTIESQKQLRLKYFSHSGYESKHSEGARIKSIGRYAFNSLPNIQVINLQRNQIQNIDKYSFANQMSSERQLLIKLAKNQLNYNSFIVGSMAGSQRPIKLELGQPFVGCNRDIEYLNESVFSAFLDKTGNQLDMGCTYVMQCDCRMKWLYDGPAFWRNSITSGPFGDVVLPCEVDSEDGVEEVSLWDLSDDYFTNCDSNESIDYKPNDFELSVNNSKDNEVDELDDNTMDSSVI